MIADDIGTRIRAAIPKEVLVDLYDEFVAQTAVASKTVKEHTGLTGKRERRATGMLRFFMSERAFEVVTMRYGGAELENNRLPGSDCIVYQPYRRFGTDGWCIFGFASHAEPGKLPTKNFSRRNGTQLNFDLSPRLDLPDIRSKTNHIFVLMLSSRDPGDVGKLREVAIAVIDSSYDHFLFYEPIEGFLAGYAAPAAPETAGSEEPLVKLKKQTQPFMPPEATNEASDKTKKKK